MLRAIIVDDEPLSVNRLKRLLEESGKIDICGTFLHPLDAIDYVRDSPIDIAFLDIFMPDMNGILLSGMLHKQDEAIGVVFVTGYDDYAIDAFEMSAIDYLLKPVTAQRLAITLSKLEMM